MNRKLKKLADAAMPDVIGLRSEYHDQWMEQFAESVIRECMELGDRALQDGKWPGDVISKHFGLK